MKNSEDKFRVMVDTIPALVWCNLPDGSNEFLNQRWHDYTGLSEEEAHGWGWRFAFHPDDLENLLDTWKGLLLSGEPGEIEARLRRFDGEYRWFLIRAVPHRDESGKIVNWYGVITDIEDRKRAEEELRQDERGFAELPMQYLRLLLSRVRTAFRSMRIRPCSTTPASPSKM